MRQQEKKEIREEGKGRMRAERKEEGKSRKGVIKTVCLSAALGVSDSGRGQVEGASMKLCICASVSAH